MAATEDMFTPLHQAIRSMIYELGGRLQRNDFTDIPASTALLNDLEHEFATALSTGCILCIVHHHAADEETVIFPAAGKFDPKLVARLIEEHHDFARRHAAITAMAREIPKHERAEDRIAAGAVLNRAVNDFFAVYLAHMNVEESQLVPMMREQFTDAQMGAMRGAIMGGMPPERLAAILRWMLPSLTPEELASMLGAVRATSPPPVLAFIGGVAASTLDPQRWRAVQQRVGW